MSGRRWGWWEPGLGGGVRARGHDQGLGLLQEEISRQEGAKPTGDLPFHWICQPYIRPG